MRQLNCGGGEGRRKNPTGALCRLECDKGCLIKKKKLKKMLTHLRKEDRLFHQNCGQWEPLTAVEQQRYVSFLPPRGGDGEQEGPANS